MPAFRLPDLSARHAAYVLPALAALGAALQTAMLYHGTSRARAFAARTRAYQRLDVDGGPRILVLGDSTGVGVGAQRPEDSVAGLLAEEFPLARVMNASVSGAEVADVVVQVRGCVEQNLHFDLAVLHVGGNDVMQATPIGKLAESCRLLMEELTKLADHVVWMSPANVGLAPIFAPPYSWLVAARSRAASNVFAKCAALYGVTFVDFSADEHRSHFTLGRRGAFAEDHLHPSSMTYRYGYAAARAAIQRALTAPPVQAATKPA